MMPRRPFRNLVLSHLGRELFGKLRPAIEKRLDDKSAMILGRLPCVRPQVLKLHIDLRELSDRRTSGFDVASRAPSLVMFREELREFGFGDRSNLGL